MQIENKKKDNCLKEGMKRSVGMRIIAVVLLLCTVLVFFGAGQNRAEEENTLPCFFSSPIKQDSQCRMLCPGGMPFGIKIKTKGVVVAELSKVITSGGAVCPAKIAGLQPGDVICRVSGEAVNTSDELVAVIEKHGGRELVFEIERKGTPLAITLTPAYSVKDKCYRAGVLVRDSIAGIGTVTFIDPQNGDFAGLGHGICHPTGEDIMPMKEGEMVNVIINRIVKGKAGEPGELRGCLGAAAEGLLTKNCPTGIYGKINDCSRIKSSVSPIPVASENEIQKGSAVIRCTLDDNRISEYRIEITNIDLKDTKTRNFTIKITDPLLIDKTGGIVQGMSGSPIIQNGRLIGAVTHVLVDDPCCGYGIFIGNMLSE